MTEFHEANRAVWNAQADDYKKKVDERGLWDKCHRAPALVLSPVELSFLRGISGKDACVLGSGDNEVVFALAGMGAKVTSVDISERQLEIAGQRARILGLEVSFLRADVTDLGEIADAAFDFVYTGGHVSVWVSDIRKYYAEGVRVLKSAGLFIVNEYHPFRRLWDEKARHLKLQYPYFNRGPFQYRSDAGLPQYEYHWTVADHIQAVIDAGCDILKVDEYGDAPDSGWQADLRGLPEHLLIVGRKRLSDRSASGGS